MGVQPMKTIDYYILPNKILCTTYGMWPDMEKYSSTRRVFACIHLMLSVSICCTLIVPQIVIMATQWRDLEILTGAGCILISITQLFFKTFYLIARREKTYTVYKELRSLWDSSNDPVERQSYEIYAYWARIYTILFYAFLIFTVIIFITSATIDYIRDDYTGNGTDSIRHLPYDIWHGLQYIKSPIFEILFVVHIVATILGIAGVCGMDCTCVATILHLSGQFRLVGTWFNNIGSKMDCNKIDYLHDCPRNLAMDLTKCIRHHQRLIKYASTNTVVMKSFASGSMVKDINNLLTPIIFIHLIISVLQICLSGFAIMSNNTGGGLFKFICVLSSAMIQLLLWCWPGEILIQESQEIGYSIYLNIPWYKLPPIYRRQLSLIILRSQEYCSISAVTFQALSIRTVTIVLNTASSYFALLRQIQENKI